MKNLYDYQDFRKALRDYYVEQKDIVPGYTYARFAAKAEISSPNYLKLVMDGERRLTTATIQAFAKAMNLEGQELDYFEALVLENQAETKREKSYYSRRLKTLKKSSQSNAVLRKTPGVKLKRPLVSALRLCSDGKTWEESVRLGNEELGLSSESANEALQSLVDSGELTLNSSGTFALSARHTMISDPKALNQAQMLSLKDGLEEAQLVFNERYTKGLAKFLSFIFTAEPGSLPMIFADLREAFEAVAEKYDPRPDQDRGVYRAQLQLYRLKKKEN